MKYLLEFIAIRNYGEHKIKRYNKKFFKTKENMEMYIKKDKEIISYKKYEIKEIK